MDDEEEGVVLVNGSSQIWAGIAGEDAPRVTFRSAVGHPSGRGQDSFVGDAPQRLRGLCALRYPVRHGLITDWDAMERLWAHAFRGLDLRPQERPCLLADAPLGPKAQREVAAQVLFEGLGCPGLSIEDKAKLSGYASGRGTCIVVSCGEGVTSVWPLYESHLMVGAVRRQDLGGGEATEHLADCLRRQGLALASSQDMETAREIKESLCRVPLREEPAPAAAQLPVYRPATGPSVTLSAEAALCGEVLFRPSLVGRSERGIHELLCEALAECDIDTRRDLFCSVIVAGGSSLFRGFEQRLEAEARALLPARARVRVVARPERAVSPWIGGSILASLSTHSFVTRAQYEEYGPAIIHEVCRV